MARKISVAILAVVALGTIGTEAAPRPLSPKPKSKIFARQDDFVYRARNAESNLDARANGAKTKVLSNAGTGLGIAASVAGIAGAVSGGGGTTPSEERRTFEEHEHPPEARDTEDLEARAAAPAGGEKKKGSKSKALGNVGTGLGIAASVAGIAGAFGGGGGGGGEAVSEERRYFEEHEHQARKFSIGSALGHMAKAADVADSGSSILSSFGLRDVEPDSNHVVEARVSGAKGANRSKHPDKTNMLDKAGTALGFGASAAGFASILGFGSGSERRYFEEHEHEARVYSPEIRDTEDLEARAAAPAGGEKKKGSKSKALSNVGTGLGIAASVAGIAGAMGGGGGGEAVSEERRFFEDHEHQARKLSLGSALGHMAKAADVADSGSSILSTFGLRDVEGGEADSHHDLAGRAGLYLRDYELDLLD